MVFSGKFTLYSTQHTLFEVEKYLPLLARKLDCTEMGLFREFQLLPVIACQPLIYELRLQEANQLIGHRDPKDVQILALTLQLKFCKTRTHPSFWVRAEFWRHSKPNCMRTSLCLRDRLTI